MDKGKKTILGILVAIVVIAVVVFGIKQAADNKKNNEPNTGAPATQQNAERQTEKDQDQLSQILENPAAFYGKQVTVNGEIQDVHSKRVFKVSNQTIGNELYVLTRQPLTERQVSEGEELFEDNADVRVKGTLRQVVIADIEREYSLDVPAQLEAEFDGIPVLVADSFTFSDKKAVFDFTQGPDSTQQ